MFAGNARELAQRTHCPHGHAYTPENTYRREDGCRRCKECRRIQGRESVRRWRAANREQRDEDAA